MLVLVCGAAAVPVELEGAPRVAVPDVPGRVEVDPLLEGCGRLVVVGTDAALAAVLTRLLRADRLAVEMAYVPAARGSAAAQVYGLPVGAAAARLALAGPARAVPLIRDDAGVALVGSAVLAGPDGEDLVGEAYVDDTRLFSGAVAAVEVRPTPQAPGLRAAGPRGLLRRTWVAGRAIQTGGRAIALTRDGVPGRRPVKRSTFYRHTQDWLLVRGRR